MLTYQTLIDDLADGCKPKKNWRIGLEHEQFLYDLGSGAPLPHARIAALLEALAARGPWQRSEDHGALIGLSSGQQVVSLEPGGQFEFSGAPHLTLAQAKAEMEAFYAQVAPLAAALGIGVLRAGFHPDWTRDQLQWMPKARYKIMRPYMEKVGGHGIDMMGRSCGTQINLDFSSEADMVRKFRVASALQPVLIALLANSPRAEGRDSGYASYRAFIWHDTDPDRCGVPGFIFGADMSFARYVDYALSVPMYFIRRGGEYIDVAGRSFRDFMDGRLPGHEGEYPQLSDWHDHLGTLFPVVRLKKYLELRGPDSVAPELVYAMAALTTGILYDQIALDGMAALIAPWPEPVHQQLYHDVARFGLATKMPGTEWDDLCGFSREVLALAEAGLARQPQNKEAAAWLAPLHEGLQFCRSPMALRG